VAYILDAVVEPGITSRMFGLLSAAPACRMDNSPLANASITMYAILFSPINLRAEQRTSKNRAGFASLELPFYALYFVVQ